MAEGRMLKKKITVSTQVADLASDTNRLLFTWGIAHLDVEGRMPGNPRKFKALVCPMLDHVTCETIVNYFSDAKKHGLIDIYESDGEWFIQYPTFSNHQNLRKDRESQSTIPDNSGITPGALLDNSGSTPAEVKLSKGKSSEVKVSEDNAKSDFQENPNPKKISKKSASMTDEQFIVALKTNPAYSHIDFSRELGKMDAWLMAHHGRQKTRKFIINWLNKIEKPISAAAEDDYDDPIPPPDLQIELAAIDFMEAGEFPKSELNKVQKDALQRYRETGKWPFDKGGWW